MHVPKKILLVTANAREDERLQIDEEVKRIKNALHHARAEDRYQIEHLGAATYDDLRLALLQHRPFVVQFSGHAEEAGIRLLNPSGVAHVISAKALRDLFREFSDDVRCVILNACLSVTQAEAIAEHVEYVVGMQERIADKHALAFSKAFWEAVAYDRAIEQAFRLGVNAVETLREGAGNNAKLFVSTKAGPSAPSAASRPSATTSLTGPVPVYFSFHGSDDKLRQRLVDHLSPMLRASRVTVWPESGVQYEPGATTEEVSQAHLKAAEITLLLVSASFLADPKKMSELDIAMARRDRGQTRVVPVLLSPCEWKEDTTFAGLAPLPPGEKPITAWKDADSAMVEVVKGIRTLVKLLRPGT